MRMAALRILMMVVACVGLARAEDQEALYDQVSAASFEVLVDGRLSGSGWFSAEEGWGFTAAHVVKNRDGVVRVRQGKKEWAARVQAVDVLHDAALLEIEGAIPAGMPFAAAFSKVGEDIYLYGAPIFRHGVWVTGKVARKEVVYEFLSTEETGIRCFHVTALTPKGMSGGPWVNAEGEVVGLQSGMMVRGDVLQGIAFVTPGDGLAALLKSKQNARTSSFRAAAEEIDEQPVDWLKKLPEGQGGVVLKRVEEGELLGKAGVKNGDLLISINGQALASRNDYHRIVSGLPADVEAVLKLRNDAGETTIVKLKPVVAEKR